jgi:hypothetical protein
MVPPESTISMANVPALIVWFRVVVVVSANANLTNTKEKRKGIISNTDSDLLKFLGLFIIGSNK